MSNVTIESNTPLAVTQPTAAENKSKAKKKPKAALPRKATKKPKKAKKAAAKTVRKADNQPGERINKKAAVLALMRRPQGATLAEIMAATNWLKHTVRGFVSILGKKGEAKIESSRNSAGERNYKIEK